MGKQDEQQQGIAISYNGKMVILNPQDSGEDFAHKLMATFAKNNDFIRVLNAFARVTGPAAQYVLDEMKKMGQNAKEKRPKIDTYG